MSLGMRKAFIPEIYAGAKKKKKKFSKSRKQQAAIAISKKQRCNK